jgi:Ras-related protein Rab-1A
MLDLLKSGSKSGIRLARRGTPFRTQSLTLNRFRTITSSYYRGAHGIIVAFDVTNAESFVNVQKWLQEVERYAGDNVQMVLVGNKCDLVHDRKVSTEEAREFAESHSLEYFETSAKDASNVDPTFIKLAQAIKDKLEE